MPTLLAGDSVIAAGTSDADLPERGDIIFFQHPQREVDYVKRLIGLPGETVQMIDGLLYIDGVPLERAPMADLSIETDRPSGDNCTQTPQGTRYLCDVERWQEVLPGGRAIEILNTGSTNADNTEAVVVPDGHVFVLGDHRDNSIDSRFPNLGMVPAENIKHSAWLVQMSFDGWVPRADRFFKRVN